MPQRNVQGQFKQTAMPWTPAKWDMGYIDNKGRFRVYRPDFPGAYQGGWCLRTHVVWWLETGELPEKGKCEIHHRNHDRLDDRFSNLEKLTKSKHRSLHQENWVFFSCDGCGKRVKQHAWRQAQRDRERGLSRGQYCSRDCFFRSNGGKIPK